MNHTMPANLMALLIAMTCVASAQADRYRVQIGNLPPILVDDARTYAVRQEPDPAAPERAPGASPFPVPSPAPLPSVRVPGPDRVVQTVPPPQPPRPPVTDGNPDQIIVGRGAGEPTQAFTTQLAADYSVTVPEEVRGVWYFLQSEPQTVPEVVRMGNAVIRWMLAMRRAPTGVSTARLDQLPPQATSGKVRAVGGLPLRVAPWGNATGAIVPQDVTVEIKPPSDGAWYHVVGPGFSGWAPGMWMELK